MIVQACLNGARAPGFHPALPLSAEALAEDARACVLAGAAELHFHPRGPDGRERLGPAAVDAAVQAVRRACPGTLFGVSTGAWIEADIFRTRACIAEWRELPDYASVNLSEPDAPALIALLDARGMGVEAGLATAADAARLVGLAEVPRLLRVLVEVRQQDAAEARREVEAIAAVLAGAAWRRPVLLHGFDTALWPLVEHAAERRWSTRVGLEDGRLLPGGEIATGNAAMVAAAVRMTRRGGDPTRATTGA